jgi:hypothetical protein
MYRADRQTQAAATSEVFTATPNWPQKCRDQITWIARNHVTADVSIPDFSQKRVLEVQMVIETTAERPMIFTIRFANRQIDGGSDYNRGNWDKIILQQNFSC